MAIVIIAGLGAGTYVSVLRPLAGRPIWTPVILMMGVSFVLDSIISIAWGAKTIFLESPVPDRVFHLPGGATINSRDLIAIAGCLLAFLAMLAFLRFSSIGARMRAAAESPIDRMFALGWALSTGVAAVGGIGYSLTTVLDPTLATIGIIGLTPALLGGLDSVGGVIVGGYLAALATNFTILYLGAPALNAVAAVILLVVLVVRPFGLFGTPAIERV
jgi:branched-chain amino acid transport system permease protein